MNPTRVHHTDIQLRFGDTDALGHLNNASYAEFAEVARLQLLHALDENVQSIILAHLSIDYLRQVTFGEAVHVETHVLRLGRSSITLQQSVIGGSDVAAKIRSVVVWFDYEKQQSRELPPAIRERLAGYTGAKPRC